MRLIYLVISFVLFYILPVEAQIVSLGTDVPSNNRNIELEQTSRNFAQLEFNNSINAFTLSAILKLKKQQPAKAAIIMHVDLIELITYKPFWLRVNLGSGVSHSPDKQICGIPITANIELEINRKILRFQIDKRSNSNGSGYASNLYSFTLGYRIN